MVSSLPILSLCVCTDARTFIIRYLRVAMMPCKGSFLHVQRTRIHCKSLATGSSVSTHASDPCLACSLQGLKPPDQLSGCWPCLWVRRTASVNDFGNLLRTLAGNPAGIHCFEVIYYLAQQSGWAGLVTGAKEYNLTVMQKTGAGLAHCLKAHSSCSSAGCFV